MRILFSLLFLALAFFLAFLLYKSIEEPINFQNERDLRTEAVSGKLEMIRNAQDLYRDITGVYAHNFDTLKQVLSEGKLPVIRVIGDADAVGGAEVTYDTTLIAARDTAANLGIVLDGIEKVPYTGADHGSPEATFDIAAKQIDYQSTTVPVVQVGVKQSAFMGKYGDARFQRYDQNYDPSKPIKFGDLTKPTLTGTWQ